MFDSIKSKSFSPESTVSIQSERKDRHIKTLVDTDINPATKFLDADFDINSGNRIKLNVALTTEEILQYTVDGINYMDLNGGIPQLARATHNYNFHILPNGKFNMRTKSGLATNIIFLSAELWLEI